MKLNESKRERIPNTIMPLILLLLISSISWKASAYSDEISPYHQSGISFYDNSNMIAYDDSQAYLQFNNSTTGGTNLSMMYDHQQNMTLVTAKVVNDTIQHTVLVVEYYSLPVKIVLSTFAALTSLITICGNVLVMLSFILDRQIRNPTNYFLLSLSVSDFFIGLFSMPFFTLYLMYGVWPFGEIFCNLWLTLDYTVCLASIYTVLFITIDRFCSVKMPAKYRKWRTRRKVILMIFFTWATPFLLFSTSIFSYNYAYDLKFDPHNCDVGWSNEYIFNIGLVITYFWLTLVVIIILYIFIYEVASNLERKSREKQRKLSTIVGINQQHATAPLLLTQQSHTSNQSSNAEPLSTMQHTLCAFFNFKTPKKATSTAISYVEINPGQGTKVTGLPENTTGANQMSTNTLLVARQTSSNPDEDFSSSFESDTDSKTYQTVKKSSGDPTMMAIKVLEKHADEAGGCESNHNGTRQQQHQQQHETGTIPEEIPFIDEDINKGQDWCTGENDENTPHTMQRKTSFMQKIHLGKFSFKLSKQSGSTKHVTVKSTTNTPLVVKKKDIDNRNDAMQIDKDEQRMLSKLAASAGNSSNNDDDSDDDDNFDLSKSQSFSETSNKKKPATADDSLKTNLRLITQNKFNLTNKRKSNQLTPNPGVDPSESQQKRKMKYENRARKALRTITFILGAFMVCFVPWHIVTVWNSFCNKCMSLDTSYLYHIYNTSYWLCYLNSPINPFVYAMANQQFRKSFTRILKRDWRRL